MKLLRLELRNFKGLRSFTLDPNGANVAVFADNGVGKTTIADAAAWLLWGKDSQGVETFDLKTLDAAGQPIHYLDHEVTGVFDVGGERLTLQKTYREKWVTARSKVVKEFEGHRTDHMVNGVPVQKGEFERIVESKLCDEKRMRLLSDPLYFNCAAKWQERRQILIEVCGDISDADVVAANEELDGLIEILGTRSLDDHRKTIAAQRKKVGEEIATIPTRIDELARSMGPPIAAEDPEPLRAKVRKLSEDRARLQAGGEVAEKTKQLRELEGEAQRIVNEIRQRSSASFDEAGRALRAAENELALAQGQASTLKFQIEADAGAIASIDRQLAELRTAFAAENARAFEYQGEDTCAACGQPLPADKVAGARALAQEEFNERKAARLQANRAEGGGLAEKKALVAQKLERKNEELAGLEKRLIAMTLERDRLKASADSLQAPTLDFGADPTYQQNLAAQEAVKAEISSLRDGTSAAAADIEAQIENLAGDLSSIEQAVARQAERVKSEARIKELGERERELAAQIEKVDRELWLCEEFVRTKVGLLTDRINARFTLARFKLFDNLINGGLVEVCETMCAGASGALVPYGSLNHGARINVGLDICQVLGEHYGLTPPIFVDGAESVTRILPTTAQQIQLVVSEPDKELRIVIPNSQPKEAISA